ncbi:MAG: hypothetical protein Q8L29_00045 [archaeon]|nr:hypothetical protein [archaeon]
MADDTTEDVPYGQLKPIKQKPTSVVVISTLFFVCVFFFIVGAGLSLFLNYLFSSIIGAEGAEVAQFTTIKTFANIFNLFFIIFLVLAVINIILGIGLMKIKNWARILATIYAIGLCLTIIGIPLGALLIYFLNKKDNRERFEWDYL